MKVLWFSITPSMYDVKTCGGWVASLERIVRQYGNDIQLGIAFEHSDKCFKHVQEGVTYYPMNTITSKFDKFRMMVEYDYEWKLLCPKMQKVIADFKPDVIQCFGTEWPFGLIAECIDIPIVIHMQGFSTIYNLSAYMMHRTFDMCKYHHYNPFSMIRYWYRDTKKNKSNIREKKIMELNFNYMGRTEWDRNIVKYFNPKARYFHCEEALRSEIINSSFSWKFQKRNKMRIVTISSASSLKGNDLILRSAQILKEFGFDFEWRVAGSKDSFKFFESILGISHENLNIKLLGMLNAENVAKELSEADVYVHTAIIDNSPNSLCEAQYLGCPIVSSYVGGIPQLIEDGKTGFFYPYNEPHTLAFKLMSLFNQEKVLKQVSNNEKNVATRRHDDKAIFEQLHGVYKDLLQ